MPATSSKKRKSRRAAHDDFEDDDDDDEDKENIMTSGFSLSQLPVEASQDIAPVKPSEQRNLDGLKPEEREKVLMDLSRLILFKALAGEPIDRLKTCKEAGIGNDQGKISTAAFAEAADRLSNVWGFELKRLPKWQEAQKSTPKRFLDRHYVVMHSNSDEIHSKKLYAAHKDVAIEKGLLMIILGLCYCKGTKLQDGSRWISDADLYRLLNKLDDNIPSEPPTPSARKAGGRQHALSQDSHDGPSMCTPDVDSLLDQFCKMDYLLKEKLAEDNKVVASLLTSTSGDGNTMSTQSDEQTFVYSMGPRAAVEIGRKQVVYFCSECLDEEPDPTMLMEYEGDDGEEEMATQEEE